MGQKSTTTKTNHTFHQLV